MFMAKMKCNVNLKKTIRGYPQGLLRYMGILIQVTGVEGGGVAWEEAIFKNGCWFVAAMQKKCYISSLSDRAPWYYVPGLYGR